MRHPLLALVLLALFTLGGCDTDSPGADAGMDASLVPDSGRSDAGPSDGGASDGGRLDAGPSDGGSSDGGSSDGGSSDGGPSDAGSVDGGSSDGGASDGGASDAAMADAGCGGSCSTPPPVCGSSCDDACGCCECTGPGFCRDGAAWNCAGDCYSRTECGDTDCSVDERGIAACGSCDALERQYQELATGTDSVSCENPGRCQALSGHCGVGLGGCHYAVNGTVTQAQLDTLAAQWTALGCDAGRPVCRCTAPPPVRCDAGGCLFGG